jgi:hypothetical protein
MPAIPIADPVAHLAGTWGVERELHDRRAGVRGRFSGTATFVPDGAALRWLEDGVLVFGGHEGPASRELRIVPTGGGWEVRFADGRPFHPLELADGRTVVEHPCRADRYTGGYEADGPDVLVVRWDATGPAKDLAIVSRYERLRAGSGAPGATAGVEAGRGGRVAGAVDRMRGAPG